MPYPALRASPRLVLRDFIDEDWADAHALRSDPDVARFMDHAPETLEQSRVRLTGVIFHDRKRSRVAYNLAVVHRAQGRVIGWIGIGPSSRYPGEGELGFGYMPHRAYWGQGYATEAVRTIVDFGFGALGGRRVSAWCYEENRASARVLAKAGLRFERRYRGAEPESGRPAECLEYALRREEWHTAARAVTARERDDQPAVADRRGDQHKT